ncbi:MAG: SDR family NAD(P)-dependent oxidoreductase [Deltaproteobacteria bacterium]|nr:MAG: SDR family NAD(P)-dependent oxidoreductase [Deltaproteobacteria bacterium]
MGRATFENGVAIVTGGASGIGRALGEELARRGARVHLADVQAERAASVADGIRRSGGWAEAAELDVTDEAAVRSRVERVVRTCGRLDYMFNNAGIAVVGEFRDQSLADVHRLLDVNLRGVVNGSHAAYAVMVAQGSGHIVNTASMAGLVPTPSFASYCASKHGVVGLSLALRAEGAALGVKVSAICPGFVHTSILENGQLVNVRSEVVRDAGNAGRLGQSPESCARAILRGVARNQPIVITPRPWRLIWRLGRLFPALWNPLGRRIMARFRRDFRAA